MRSRIKSAEINDIIMNLEEDLPKDVINIINFIAHKVGAPSYRKTPNFKKQHNNRHVEKITGEDWAAIRNFKTTFINMNKDGIMKAKDDIRCLLNKITEKSYNDVKVEIIEKVKNLKEDFTDEEFKSVNIGALIFNIGSKNKFCSHLYAKLYKELSIIYVEFSLISNKHYETYGKIFDEIKYVDPDTDYNLYCDYNKENENRKTMSLFFTNLMKYGVFQKEQLMILMLRLIKSIETCICEENNIEIVEETVTNLLIFIANGVEELNECEDWNKVILHIEKMSNAKKKNYKSLTTKTTFKYMDLLDQ
jgi:hypothetical protein